MAVNDLAFQHVEKLHALMLEGREHVGILGQRDQIGLDDDAAGVEPIWPSRLYWWPARVPRRSIVEPFAGLDEDGVALFLEAAEEGGDRNAERARQRLQGGRATAR